VIEYFHLKTEEFQYCIFNSLTNLEVVSKIDEFVYHYNEERIQKKLDYLTPKEFGVMAT
jgi:transposase InsO family protein